MFFPKSTIPATGGLRTRGGSRIFTWGGGGVQKIMCARTNIIPPPSPYAIRAIFLSILIQNGILNNIADQKILGVPHVPPMGTANTQV